MVRKAVCVCVCSACVRVGVRARVCVCVTVVIATTAVTVLTGKRCIETLRARVCVCVFRVRRDGGGRCHDGGFRRHASVITTAVMVRNRTN